MCIRDRLQPERILFLYTSQSEEILDKVMDFCCLRMSQVEKSKVNETNQTDIYREIKRCYLEWGKPEKIYIDFTGGTKAMSTAAAMAGAMIHVQMIYVGTSQYCLLYTSTILINDFNIRENFLSALSWTAASEIKYDIIHNMTFTPCRNVFW